MSIFATVGAAVGVSETVTKAVTGFVGIMGLCFALWWVVDKIGDGRENKLRLDAAETVLENIGVADAVDDQLENRDDDAADKLEEVIDDAVANDPEAAGTAAGPVTNDVADELRRQRATGER